MNKSIYILLLSMSAAYAGTYDNVATKDMLGAQVAYFEKYAGPAKNILNMGNGKFQRVYKIGQCQVTTEVQNKTITSLEFDTSSKCDFDAGNIGLSGRASALTFQVLDGFGPLQAEEACVALCGNAVEPSYSGTISGSRAMGFVNYTGTTTYTLSEKVITPFGKELLKITKTQDESDLFEYVGDKISQDRYNALFLKYFKNIRLSSIKIHQ